MAPYIEYGLEVSAGVSELLTTVVLIPYFYIFLVYVLYKLKIWLQYTQSDTNFGRANFIVNPITIGTVLKMLADHRATVDEICRQSARKKTAELTTWSHLMKTIIWRHFVIYVGIHVIGIGGSFMYVSGLHSEPVKRWTIAWFFIVAFWTGFGVTAGAHRLWTHRTYKATLPLRILLVILYTAMGSNPLYYWIRDHRVHHKYSETDADPHNAKRGFVFSHMGWLVMRRHPECIRRGREMDMSDIEADAVVMFQKKYELSLKLLLCFILPSAVPVLVWKETIFHAIVTQCFIRYLMMLNVTFCVNSVAHLWGSRPYNRSINPAENLMVSCIALGEGSHNYHHTFPWDYKTSELPYMNFNSTTLFIDAMAKLGWAYDLRKAYPKLVKQVTERIGYKSYIHKCYEDMTRHTR